MRLEDRFEVPASKAEAWALLNDVPSVIPCMPGAELKEVVGPDAWRVTVRLKLGPIALEFDTEVQRAEADEAEGRVVLTAKAKDVKGRGGAVARIESRLADVEAGTEVTIDTDLELQGSVAQYGRGGIVMDVSAQLTKQFADCLAARLAASPAAEPAAGPADAAPGAAAAPKASSAPAPAAKPIGGIRLALRALLRRILRLGRSGRAD